LLTRIADAMTVGLAREYGDELWIEFDTEDVPALQESKEKLREDSRNAFNDGIIMLNEARSFWGLDPDPNGNCYKHKMGDKYVPEEEILEVEAEVVDPDEEEEDVPEDKKEKDPEADPEADEKEAQEGAGRNVGVLDRGRY